MSEDYGLPRRAAAEFVGTFSIVFFGAGAVALDVLTAPDGVEGEFILDGLGHGGLGWIGIALAFLASIAVPIYVFGRVSGGHINPAVTAALWLDGRIDARAAGAYVLAQLAGGVAGGVVFTLVRGTEAVTVGGMGATAPFPGVEPWQALLAEVVITLFLMATVMALAVDDRGPANLAGLGIGLVVAGGVLATGNVSGASFNPARTLGPYVTSTVFGGPSFWAHAWIYVVGPVAGAVGGLYLYEFVVGTGTDAADEPDAEPPGAAAESAAE